MLVYFIAYMLMAIAAIVFVEAKNKKISFRQMKCYYCFCFAILWTIILGLRHPQMGYDLRYGFSNGYFGMYNIIAEQSWKEILTHKLLNYEIGYSFFCKVLSTVTKNPMFLVFVCAAIPIISASNLMYSESKCPFMSSVIYLGLPFFLLHFSGYRQLLAVAITMFSFRFIKMKKFWKFFATVLFAACIHKSAILFLVAYPVYHIKTTKKEMLLSLIILPLVYIFSVPIFMILKMLIKPHAKIEITHAIWLFVFFCIIYLFTIIFGKEEDREETGLRNLFFLACFCQAFSGIYNTAMRVGYYFMVYLSLLLPQIVYNNRPKKDSENKTALIMYGAIVAFFVAFGLYSLFKPSYAQSYPYKFFWQ